MKRGKVFLALLVAMVGSTIPTNGMAQSSVPSDVGDRLVDIKKCIAYLEKTGNLIRVKSEVDPNFELAGIAKKYEGGKCILFEKVKGSKVPVSWVCYGIARSSVNCSMSPRKSSLCHRGCGRGWRKDKKALSSKVLEKGPANEVYPDQRFKPL